MVEAISQGGGFTPGFASVLVCEDGSRHFVKAASSVAQPVFADSYREEARKLGALPETVPAPRLLWVEDGDWVVLGLEYVEAACAAAAVAGRRAGPVSRCGRGGRRRAHPGPDGLDLDPVSTEFAAWPGLWTRVGDRDVRPHADEAAALAATYAEVTGGETLVHTDLRDDNALLTTDGRALFCDWNWPVVGAPWLDSVILLISPRGDGLDVERSSPSGGCCATYRPTTSTGSSPCSPATS